MFLGLKISKDQLREIERAMLSLSVLVYACNSYSHSFQSYLSFWILLTLFSYILILLFLLRERNGPRSPPGRDNCGGVPGLLQQCNIRHLVMANSFVHLQFGLLRREINFFFPFSLKEYRYLVNVFIIFRLSGRASIEGNGMKTT